MLPFSLLAGSPVAAQRSVKHGAERERSVRKEVVSVLVSNHRLLNLMNILMLLLFSSSLWPADTLLFLQAAPAEIRHVEILPEDLRPAAGTSLNFSTLQLWDLMMLHLYTLHPLL